MVLIMHILRRILTGLGMSSAKISIQAHFPSIGICVILESLTDK